MKYAILGDIHANLCALEGVLAAIDAEGADRIVSVGDVVGYGAAPKEAIDLLREHGVIVVKGNHDAACVGEIDPAYFNPYARAAVDWTRAVLERVDLAWLAALPLTVELEHCQVSHGTLAHPERFDYIQTVEDAVPSLDELTRLVCFVGHTHVPVSIVRLVEDPTRAAYTLEPEVDLGEVQAAVVNVGSVGQPRDEDRRAAYAVFEASEARVSLRRVEYDIEREAARIRRAGLPDMLAERLFLGV